MQQAVEQVDSAIVSGYKHHKHTTEIKQCTGCADCESEFFDVYVTHLNLLSVGTLFAIMGMLSVAHRHQQMAREHSQNDYKQRDVPAYPEYR